MDFTSNFSQMTQVTRLDLDDYNPEVSFQIYLDDDKSQNNKDNKNLDLDLLSNDLRSLLKNDLSDSIMNLTQCFICLSQAKFPVSCPKCNNFACKTCFKNYFGDEESKQCPLCKQYIQKSKLKKNKTIREIEKILYKEDSKTNKINKLSKLIEEKKNIWENQESYLNHIINKILKYQDNLKEYKNKYELYFISWKKIIDNIFEQFEKKITDLLDLLIKYNRKYNNDFKNSILRYNQLKEKNKISNNDINSLVNEIISMERNHFNQESKIKNIDGQNIKTIPSNIIDGIIQKSKAFFITPIFIIPNISNYNIETLYIGKKELNKGNIKIKNYNVHVGYYQIEYIFKDDKYSALCKLYIKNDRKVSFFVIQKKVIDNKSYELISMKDSSDSTHYIYETMVDFNEIKEDSNIVIRFETKVQIFSVIA